MHPHRFTGLGTWTVFLGSRIVPTEIAIPLPMKLPYCDGLDACVGSSALLWWSHVCSTVGHTKGRVGGGQGYTDRASGVLVALVGPAIDAGLGESVDDAVLAGRTDVVDGPGQGRRGPQQAVRSIGSSVPSSWTNVFIDAARTALASVGARAARTSTASVT